MSNREVLKKEQPMDRIDAMKVFVAALDEGSLAAAGRKLGRSPAAVSRAMTFLEGHVGLPLLYRTSRSSKLSEIGERYAVVCRRVLTDLEEAETLAETEKNAPTGTLSVTAPVLCGEEVLRPIMDEFLDSYPTVSARLTLLDRPVNLIDEGIDVALRIGQLPDSSMIATRVGEVRRVIVAAPSYLARHPRIDEPGDLASQQIIAVDCFGVDSWAFPGAPGSTISRAVQFTPRVVVDSVRAAVASAVDGHGVTRLFSYQVAQHVKDGRLQIVLSAEEHGAWPVYVVMPDGRRSVPKVRAFLDFAVPRLRAQFACLALEPGTPSTSPTPVAAAK
jgi:DNA-binding transcriptional LysR family regulator